MNIWKRRLKQTSFNPRLTKDPYRGGGRHSRVKLNPPPPIVAELLKKLLR